MENREWKLETASSKLEIRNSKSDVWLAIFEFRFSNFDYRVSLFRSILTPDFFHEKEEEWKQLIGETS